jgi:hypothetical protein
MRAGLTVNAKLDTRQYPITTKMIRTEEMVSVNLESHARYGRSCQPIGPSRRTDWQATQRSRARSSRFYAPTFLYLIG